MHPVIPATFGKPVILRVIVAVVLPMIVFGQPASTGATNSFPLPGPFQERFPQSAAQQLS